MNEPVSIFSANRTYESARIGVDGVIFSVNQENLLVFLNNREKEPFINKAELIGGLLLPGETAEETLCRKVEAALPKVKDLYFQQFFTFTKPNRDPRERTISIGFFALIPSELIDPDKGWYAINDLPALAFDHEEIISKARKFIAERRDFLDACYLLPKFFTLNALHKIAEALHDTKYDNRNFRRLVINSGSVRETNKMSKGLSHRPAKLYEFIHKK